MDTPTKCWYCGKGPMVNDSRITKCTQCGATWVPPVTLGNRVLERVDHGDRIGMAGSPGAGAQVRDLNTGELKKAAVGDET